MLLEESVEAGEGVASYHLAGHKDRGSSNIVQQHRPSGLSTVVSAQHDKSSLDHNPLSYSI
jgi:hypothetical protein